MNIEVRSTKKFRKEKYNPEIVIFHNPKCSKSRQALKLLEEKGIQPIIIEYTKHPPKEKQLELLIKQLGIPAIELLRKKEKPYKDLGLSEKSTKSEIIQAITNHPILLERPIVLRGNKAKIGRPPEGILELF